MIGILVVSAAVLVLFLGAWVSTWLRRTRLRARGRVATADAWLSSFRLSPCVSVHLATQILHPVALSLGCEVTSLRPSDSVHQPPVKLGGLGQLTELPEDLMDDIEDALEATLGKTGADYVWERLRQAGDGWTLGDLLLAVDTFMALVQIPPDLAGGRGTTPPS